MKLATVLAVSVSVALLWGCAAFTPLPDETSLDHRLARFPAAGVPIDGAVTVYWNEHQIPFIEAERDEDLAFVLGMVHAHLRLAQMTVLRRIATGRLAESAGPLASDIDHALRILNFGRGAAAFEAALPHETRAFLGAFVRGINHYQAQLPRRQLPHEFAVMGLEREPWRIADVLTVGRLAGTDINWLGYFALLKLRERPDWPELWARILKTGGASMTSFSAGDQARVLEQLLVGNSRSGSNTLAIGGARSANGSALLASDPHLGLQMPNLWLVAGFKSPSYHAAGLMIPGIPFVAVGRNPDVGWGGTNMRAASSDLFDLTSMPERIRSRRERIKVRWWLDRTVTVRDSPLGPVISDLPQLGRAGKPPFALRWVGHEHGDEISAMLRVQRARNWSEFRAAFATFAVSAQNMLYADRAGNIGQVMATMLPVRLRMVPPDMILDPADPASQWHGIAHALQLPAAYNPRAGLLASANNRPTETPFPVGYVFSPDDRVSRMQEMMAERRTIALADLKAVQLDVYVKSAVTLRDAYLRELRRLRIAAGGDANAALVLTLLEQWDGHYRIDARGPVAFELFHHYFQHAHYVRRYGEQAAEIMFGIAAMPRMLLEDLPHTPEAELRTDLAAALGRTGKRIGSFANWGEMHRLGLAHPLAFVPVIGGKYRFGDMPAGGSSESLMKTAHSSGDQRHFARFGQQARFLADMSDPDSSYVVLLGGQDGWINSTTALDQVGLWRRGEYVQLPLRLETVRTQFGRVMRLRR
jgi:penicillin amidase